MKQYQFEYTDIETLKMQLGDFKSQRDAAGENNLLFQVFSALQEPDLVQQVCAVIGQIFPDAPYMGCTTSGNIINCKNSAEITIAATVFTSPSTQVRVFQYDRNKYSVAEVSTEIKKQEKENPWVKAVELYFTIPEGSTTEFCDSMGDIAPDVQIFGGVACSGDITSDVSAVFSKDGEYSDKSIITVFYGGDDFYVESIKITGWKPLGRKFHVTKSDGCILQELDKNPAYDIYKNYLNINNDENFFYNTLEFPLFYEHNDTTILRVPVASNEDGSLTMSSDIDVGAIVRISYGDPRTIIDSIRVDSENIRKFQPDLLHIFSCAARSTFWTTNEATYELYPFKEIAASAGFFSHGEFLRTKGRLNQHNVTLVIAAMREGEKDESALLKEAVKERRLSKVPLISRLATFISATSLELEEINKRLETANANLRKAAITDGMTGLFNRKEIQRQITEALASPDRKKVSLLMLDIDNFKRINDTYGHQEGDMVIRALANLLQNEQSISGADFSAGRWGGEEFMMLLNNTELSTAVYIAELFRRCFANTTYPQARPQTVSIGVTQARSDDTVDSLCVRVDTALYKAKQTGKNKVVTA